MIKKACGVAVRLHPNHRSVAVCVDVRDQLCCVFEARLQQRRRSPSAIAEASGNALFNQIVTSFVPLMRVAVPQAWMTRQTAEEKADILDRHRRLAWAIANRDAEEAARCMASHFDEAIGALLR